jgi:hypothetical protein
VDSEDKPLDCVDYVLYLEHDIKIVGTTDKYGVSQRVTTSIEVGIKGFNFNLDNTYKEEGYKDGL